MKEAGDDPRRRVGVKEPLGKEHIEEMSVRSTNSLELSTIFQPSFNVASSNLPHALLFIPL
jgi:hypothetical protein